MWKNTNQQKEPASSLETSLSRVSKRKNRRPVKNSSNHHVSNKLTMLSANSASLKNKLFSLSKIINDINLSLICLQETHYEKEGSIKFKGDDKYQIFEKLRVNKSGGGLAVIALKELNPIWLWDGEI